MFSEWCEGSWKCTPRVKYCSRSPLQTTTTFHKHHSHIVPTLAVSSLLLVLPLDCFRFGQSPLCSLFFGLCSCHSDQHLIYYLDFDWRFRHFSKKHKGSAQPHLSSGIFSLQRINCKSGTTFSSLASGSMCLKIIRWTARKFGYSSFNTSLLHEFLQNNLRI